MYLATHLGCMEIEIELWILISIALNMIKDGQTLFENKSVVHLTRKSVSFFAVNNNIYLHLVVDLLV